MGRPKKMTEDEIVYILGRYFTERKNGRVSNMGAADWGRIHGYDVGEQTFRRSPAAQEWIQLENMSRQFPNKAMDGYRQIKLPNPTAQISSEEQKLIERLSERDAYARMLYKKLLFSRLEIFERWFQTLDAESKQEEAESSVQWAKKNILLLQKENDVLSSILRAFVNTPST